MRRFPVRRAPVGARDHAFELAGRRDHAAKTWLRPHYRIGRDIACLSAPPILETRFAGQSRLTPSATVPAGVDTAAQLPAVGETFYVKWKTAAARPARRAPAHPSMRPPERAGAHG